MLPAWLVEGEWVYNGGGTGARTLLGAVAASTIGVAGTVFSITIAALSLAAGQMGPRLLRNFTRDRGVQLTLGAFLGTFCYALMVLRSARTQDEGAFTPHLSLTVGILLASLCVATLLYFVGHMAGRINVDTVVELVSDELLQAIRRLGTTTPPPEAPPASFWAGETPIIDRRRGYLQEIDAEGLAPTGPRSGASPCACWCGRATMSPRHADRDGERGERRRRGGGACPLGTRCDEGQRRRPGIRRATAGRGGGAGAVARHQRPPYRDQRPRPVGRVALRPGAGFLASGVHLRGGRPALVVPSVDYPGFCDAMFHMIRQNAAGSAAVLIRLLEVLTAVASCERDPGRVAALQRHADLVLGDARRDVATPADLADLEERYVAFERMKLGAALPPVSTGSASTPRTAGSCCSR